MNVIDYKYAMLLSSRLEGFTVKTTSPLKINCRCVICGDSQKNKSKKRGWITEFKDSARYGCFNCGVSLWLRDFLKEVDPALADEYLIEGKLEWMANNGIVKREEVPQQKKLVFKGDPLSGLKKISQLPHDHPVKDYVNSRGIPSDQHYRIYYTPKFNKYVNSLIPDKLNTDRDEPRLVLPFLNQQKKVIGFTGRAFAKDSLRYLTIMLEDSPKAFGLEVVDFEKKNYCVEGPIDSFFLDNCWAMSGADVSIGNDNTVYIYDNEPRNVEIVKRIGRDIERGRKVVIWPEKISNYGKDINDFSNSGLTKSNIQSIIDKNTHFGLMAKVSLAEWRKC